MGIVVAVLLMFVAAGAYAQEKPVFSDPPVGIADFVPDIVNPPKAHEAIMALGDLAEPIANEVIRGGLCPETDPTCLVAVRVEVVRRYRCIAQDGREFPCGLRMAWKEREPVRVAARYLMIGRGIRAEGVAVDDLVTGYRFFRRGDGPNPAWEELANRESIFWELLAFP